MASGRTVTGLGDRLKEARERWGGYGDTGRTRFATETGIPYNSLREYEVGKSLPGAWALMRISKVSGVSADYLLHGGEKAVLWSPMTLVDNAVRAIANQAEVTELGRVERHLFDDRVSYVALFMRRSVMELRLYLRRLHARSTKVRFDLDEERRELIREDGEDAPLSSGDDE